MLISWVQMDFLVPELYRILKPGAHGLPTSKTAYSMVIRLRTVMKLTRF